MSLFGLDCFGRLIVVLGVLVGVGSVAFDGSCDLCCPPISQEFKSRLKNVQYQPTIQTSALGIVYSNITTKTVSRCASACLHDDSCKSFNYCEVEMLCQLSAAVKSENHTALKSPGRCVYFADEARDAWKDAPSQVAGSLKHVSIGEAGVWGVDSQDNIHYRAWCGCSWTLIADGKLKQVDVGKNVVWGVSSRDLIYYRKVSSSNPSLTYWINVDGLLKHVSVSQKGHVWGVNVHNMIYHRRDASVDRVAGSDWIQIVGGLVQVSIGNGGVWGVNADKRMFHREGTYGDPDSDPDGSAWEHVPSEISMKYVSSGDVIYAINTNDAIYYRVGTSADSPTGTAWKQIGGNLKQIESVSSILWGVDAENNIYTNDTY
ncbi:perivitellin-2 31 kDa subunit-like [Asterias amurensis]|uniref:perivitellin-2 31 kDa subunit-like n=1 Tax=Asterias amurensis TaxID=7602 RepID=UPI003AB79C23